MKLVRTHINKLECLIKIRTSIKSLNIFGVYNNRYVCICKFYFNSIVENKNNFAVINKRFVKMKGINTAKECKLKLGIYKFNDFDNLLYF